MDVRARTEQWLRRRGLPLLVADYGVERDVWARATPVLVGVFLLETLNALRGDWPWWANVASFAGALALVVAAWAAVNAARGQPPLARPERVGTPEVLVFLAVPPLVPLVFNGQVGSAGATLAANAALLGGIWVVAGFGLVAMARWAAEQAARQLGDVFATVVRALPLLLLFVTFLFVNTEAWQVAGTLPWASIALVGSLFVVVGALFAVLRLPRQVGALEGTGATPAELVRGTPVEEVAGGEVPPAPPLTRRQRANLGLVVLVSEAVQIVVVTLGVLGFFVGFGFLAVDASVVTSWLGTAPDVLASVRFAGRDMVVTTELLKVATFLALFSGLYFTVSLLTDATYREEFLDEVVDEVRRALAVRAVYLAALDHEPEAGSSTLPGT